MRKVAIISRWGATCGVSLHAELLTWEFRRKGLEVDVYAPTLESASRDWHHIPLGKRDPPWVRRVYNEVNMFEFPDGGWVDPRLDLSTYDVVIVEGYRRLPLRKLTEVLRKTRDAQTILVFHEPFPRDLEPFITLWDWDYIVFFDERYKKLLERVPNGEKLVDKAAIIPYPFLILETSKNDGLDYDGCVLVSYGRQPLIEYLDYVVAVRKLVEKGYRVVYRVVRCSESLPLRAPWLIQEIRVLDHENVYALLKASHIHLVPKWDHPGAVVSSTIAQALYAGIPTVVPDVRHFETIPSFEEGGPLVKYRLGDVEDLVAKLETLLKDESLRKELGRRAKEYAWKFRAEVVAEMFMRLFSR